ncbi:MAG: hypothetical protein M0R40_02890 [Firmicutes bacterium]|nr:hypothetical protein [Bacillota bacterium]
MLSKIIFGTLCLITLTGCWLTDTKIENEESFNYLSSTKAEKPLASNGTQKAKTTTEEKAENEISGSEAVNLCYEVLGEKAVETGFALSYQYVDSVEIENKKYYVISMYWLVEDSHLSFIGNAMVSNSGHEIFDGILEQDGSYIIAEKIWSK